MAGLKDQLLKSGLVNEKQLKKAIKEQGKQNRSGPRKDESTANADYLAAQRDKQARDRDLNRQRLESQNLRALRSEAQQLIDAHRFSDTQGEAVFNLSDSGMVKTLHIQSTLKSQLTRGLAGVVKLDGPYQFVSRETAERIRERWPDAIVLLNTLESEDPGLESGDPYAQYVIPDDLTW